MEELTVNDFFKEARAYAQKIGQKNIRLAKENGVKFYTGKIIISEGVQHLGYSDQSSVLQKCLSRYKNGDYGKQPEEDIEINERSIACGYGDVM